MIRKWLFPLLTIGFIWVLFSRLAEIEELGSTLARSRVEWLLVALGLDYEEAMLALILVGYLWVKRRQFQALSDPPSYQQGIWALAWAFLFTLTYGAVGFYILDRHFIGSFDFEEALRQTIRMFADFDNPRLWLITAFGRYFAGSIYAVGAMSVSYAFWMLARPVLRHGMASQRKRAQAQRIVEKHGHSAVARFALFPEKSYWFSPGGSVVAYAVHSRMAVALGDPIGPEQDINIGHRGLYMVAPLSRLPRLQ